MARNKILPDLPRDFNGNVNTRIVDCLASKEPFGTPPARFGTRPGHGHTAPLTDNMPGIWHQASGGKKVSGTAPHPHDGRAKKLGKVRGSSD